ncbi:MAG: SPOR domain-containing protein [Candidatus Accumulibacter sp.]|jgi:hypothetical protein|nr:SPOR domain-containing protein [Accumulibacter sp.]
MPMRILVFVLVFANLLFFAWARGYLGSGEPEALRAGDQLRADQMRIVSNDKPPPETRARAENAAAPEVEAPAPAAPRAEVCLVLSEVPQNEADAVTRLFAEKLPAFRLSRAAMPGNSNYWVYIPPLKTRRDAENKVAELKRLGVKEYYIMPEGADGFAISLGVFSTRERAESTLAALRERGVRSSRLAERIRGSGLAQIEFAGPAAQAGEARQALVQALPQAKLGACGHGAAP